LTFFSEQLSGLDDVETKDDWPFYTKMMFVSQSEEYGEGVIGTSSFVAQNSGHESSVFENPADENFSQDDVDHFLPSPTPSVHEEDPVLSVAGKSVLCI
jgi:hypothetical protein